MVRCDRNPLFKNTVVEIRLSFLTPILTFDALLLPSLEARETLSPWKILIFPVVGSIVLVVLFFWLNKIFWLLTGIIAISSFSSVSYVLYPVWFKLLETAPYSYRYRTFRLPARVANCSGITILPTAVVLAALVSIGVIVLWLCTSSWVVTNLIASCLVITGIISIPLSAGKIATILLSIFWIYDIFWVFISPLIFPKNVMETVAIGVAQLQLPLVLKLPRLASFATAPTSHSVPHLTSAVAYFQLLFNRSSALEFLMLGLGDVILPGLALNFFYRRDELLAQQYEDSLLQLAAKDEEEDEESGDNFPRPSLMSTKAPSRLTYYLVAQLGYVFGMVLTFVMLILLKRGQPALLYLVPCTLLPPFFLAWRRKQLGWLWNSLSDEEIAAVDAEAQQVDENGSEQGSEVDGEEMQELDSSSEMEVDNGKTVERTSRRRSGGDGSEGETAVELVN